MKVKLMTDSTSQIPAEYAEEKNIVLIEPTIDIKGDYKKELSEVDYKQFVSQMKHMNPVPKTSVANPQDILDIFNKAIEEGYTDILYLYVTPELTNQIAPVKLAYKKVKDKIKDQFYSTGHAATSQAPFTLYAQELLEKGESITTITKTLDKLKTKIFTMGVSTTFDILFRTGKIKKTTKMSIISTLMRLKPLYISTLDKGFGSAGAGTGFGSAVKKIIAKAEEDTDANIEYNLIVSHVQNEKLGKKLENKIKQVRKIKDTKIWEISPCVANSLGYGTVMITLYPTLDSL